MTVLRCKDCAPDARQRSAPYPGPRCYTHHRERKKAQRKRAHDLRVAAIYGLPPGEYDKIYESQGGRCYICRWASGKTKRLAVDHDHHTGRVRGLLCGPCNQFVGYVHNDPEAFKRGAHYLERDWTFQTAHIDNGSSQPQ